MQPYDMEVGAGTFHPATFLAAIGPEPSSSAYVQPSRRPTDGRYGENPNRMQHYFQYQVVLKPSPADFQEIYIESLVNLGIDPLHDDIRFVEDDWESPTLGAWGLGWEVWLNGMEITQVTYFQQVGGLECRPVTGEITYGLERIAMYVQGVDSVYDLRWNDSLSYGDIYLQNEQEQSAYNFEKADTDVLLNQFVNFENQCNELVALNLSLPAYEQVLRASHTFNLLDARRVIGVTERARYIGRVRNLARKVAETYYASRKAKNFPRLSRHEKSTVTGLRSEEVPASDVWPEAPATLLIEIGTEELPPDAVNRLSAELEQNLKQELLFAGLIDSLETDSKWYATPRRISVSVEKVKPRREDTEVMKRGPPLQKAYDDRGVPSAAAVGFANSCGVDVSKLISIETEKGNFVACRFIEPGREAYELIPSCVQNAVSGLSIAKKMRWGNSESEFVRPVHWVVLLHGKSVVPCDIFSISSASESRGHRFHFPEPITIRDADSYLELLNSTGKVKADWGVRRQTILEQIRRCEKSAGGLAMNDENLLDQVTNLVEWPFAFCGEFDSVFLNLPEEVLVSSMCNHQKYFPVFDAGGKLLPKFIGIANIEPANEKIERRIVKGNERVLHARLSDAKFFWEQDRNTTLEQKTSLLRNLMFHKALGSVLSKSVRMSELASYVASKLRADGTAAHRSAALSKADLVTELVGEFPDLQGSMGRRYAEIEGELSAVATAIGEHYSPRTANDALPQSEVGRIVAITDRIDSLLGLMAAGEKVKADRDPFSLRRMALAVLRIIIECDVDLDLNALLHESARIYTKQNSVAPSEVEVAPDDDTVAGVFEFMLERLRSYYLDQGYLADEFAAVYELKPTRPLEFDKRLRAVRQFRELAEYSDLIAANKRISNILRQSGELKGVQVKPELLVEQSELQLYEQAMNLSKQIVPLIRASDHGEILRKLAVLRDPIDSFFDDVMVMAEDKQIRRNRVALVGFVSRLFREVAEISLLQPVKVNG